MRGVCRILTGSRRRCRRADQAALPAKEAKQSADCDEQRDGRNPDQNSANQGEQDHSGNDADHQYEQRDAERPKPGDVDAMRLVRCR